MSWVTDVLLLVSLEEKFDQNDNLLDHYPAVEKVNEWLAERKLGELKDLSVAMVGGGKVPQAGVFGGAFDFLPIEEFRGYVKSLNWNYPEHVQLLLKDEEELSFTLSTQNA